MQPLSLSEVSLASRNALLSTKLSRTLRHIQKGHIPTVDEKAMLARGETLLREMLQGSFILERKPLDQGVRADLLAYGSALSTLAELNALDHDTGRVLKQYQSDLNRVIEGRRVDRGKLAPLTDFFRVLGDLLFREVQNVNAPPRHEQIDFANMTKALA